MQTGISMMHTSCIFHIDVGYVGLCFFRWWCILVSYKQRVMPCRDKYVKLQFWYSWLNATQVQSFITPGCQLPAGHAAYTLC